MFRPRRAVATVICSCGGPFSGNTLFGRSAGSHWRHQEMHWTIITQRLVGLHIAIARCLSDRPTGGVYPLCSNGQLSTRSIAPYTAGHAGCSVGGRKLTMSSLSHPSRRASHRFLALIFSSTPLAALPIEQDHQINGFCLYFKRLMMKFIRHAG